MVKVSVVVPSFNEEKYIGKCLDSLLKQTYEDMEIIVIDDGSKDKTPEIIRDYEKKYRSVTFLTQGHKGPGVARNLGAEKAKGEILVFVDSDMEFDRDYVKILVEPILKGEAVGTSHRHEHIANLNSIWARCWSTEKVDESENVKAGVIFRAVKKDEFLKVGGFNPKAGFFDDVSVPKKINVPSIRTEAVCYHNNPSSLLEVFKQSRWIGGSFVFKKGAFRGRIKKWKYLLCALMVALLLIFFKLGFFYFAIAIILGLLAVLAFFTLRRAVKEKFLPYIFALPVFYSVKFCGIFVGTLTQVMNITTKKIQSKEATYRY